MDTIILEDIAVQAIIGTLEHERVRKQRVVITLELSGDFSAAAASDDYHDTFDYSAVERAVHEKVSVSSFHLIEALSAYIAEIALSFKGVERVRVRLSKPGAGRYASCVSIVTERAR